MGKTRRVPPTKGNNTLALCNVGVRLRELRVKSGISKKTLCKQLGITQAVLDRIELRGDCLLSTLNDYINALGAALEVRVMLPEAESSAQQLSLFEIPKSPPKDIVFSVHPVHAEKILEGTKTVELRRRFPNDVKPGTLALIYSTSPTRALTGYAEIQAVQQLTIKEIWDRYRTAACLHKVDFDAYFYGLQKGYAIVLAEPRALARPIALSELRKNYSFEPPQSYQYASADLRELVADEWSQGPH